MVAAENGSQTSVYDVVEGVPVIDISPLLTDTNAVDEKARAVISEIGDACEKWGFFQVTGHGVSPDLSKRFDDQMKAFFALPLESKLKVNRTNTNSRGFFHDELTKQVTDWKEGFDFGQTEPSDIDGYNQFPTESTDSFDAEAFRTTLLEYYASMRIISARLMSAIALSLGKDADFFQPFFEPHHSSFLRLNYYPICQDASKHLGVNRHTDAGALTVLVQDTYGPVSLQVLQDTDRWVSIPPVPDAFVINIGDMVQVWSNDRYKANEHRVLANNTAKRFSAPFFYNPTYDIDVQPMFDPPVYRSVNWGEFRRRRFEGDYADVGEEVQISHFCLRQ